MKKTLLFVAIVLACTNLRAQLFTKVTNQIIVEDSANSVCAAWGDYNNAGNLSLYLPVWNPSPNDILMQGLMYQNNCNGNFTQITAIPGGLVSDPNEGIGAYWIDYNNDGNLDLYTWDSRDPAQNNMLYKNLGNGSFEKVNTAVSSIRTNRINCTFADFNNDGWLDFYTGDSSIYISDKHGNFTRMSPSPIFRNTDPTQLALYCSASCVDYNNDGYMDLLVIVAIQQPSGQWANNLFMYTNNGHGGFTQSLIAPPYLDWFPNYGHAWGDYDNDGNIDLWVNGNPPYPNHLFHNNGDGTFTEVHTGPVVAVQPYNNQGGASFCDYNNDGWLDLFQPTLYQNYLFDNNGDGTFTQDTTEIVTKDSIEESYGSAWVDYNNNGAMDLFVPVGWGNADNFLYKNVIYQNNGNSNHWLEFKCVGVTSNRDAIGARIYAKATIKGKPVTQLREINANTTTAGESGGASGHIVHMGFGDASVIDTLKIVWPASHTTQIFTNVPANQILQITEGVNNLTAATPCKPDFPPSNPGYVTGKLFSDINNNCSYDAGVDFPIANQLIKASPGPYFVYTDDNGNYTFSLPAGTYSIALSQERQEDNWAVRSCQNDSFVVNVMAGDTIINKNFAVYRPLPKPCNGSFSLTISSMNPGIQGPCPHNLILTNPCPGFEWDYCFKVQNNTTSTSPSPSYLSVTFPSGFLIQSISCTDPLCNASLSSGVLTNTGIIKFTNSFTIGQSCDVCVLVYVNYGTNPPYYTQATYSQTTPVVNLITNGDFDNASTTPPVGFTSQYTPNGCAPPDGDYHIASSANGICGNSNWSGTGFPAGAGYNFLIADGAEINPSPNYYNVWTENPILAVTQNTNYAFLFWYTNIDENASNWNAPDLNVSINGNPPFLNNLIPLYQGIWFPSPNIMSSPWCSQNATTATINIYTSSIQQEGNDFGIDHISFIKNAYSAGLTQQNSCGCDPNDKDVSPEGCGVNGNISKDQMLTYRVRFQNTGTGPAHNILLRDELDPNLDINTLQILASSYPITSAQIIPNNTLIVEFDNINLPDSASNQTGSWGFVVFSILPKSGLPDGTVINDQSGVYFDSNTVVLTNSTINTLYDKPQPNASFTFKHDCSSTGIVYDFTYTGNTPDSASYLWTFNGATPATSTLQNPLGIIFNTTGYKLVTLTVNRYGCSETVSDTILAVNVSSLPVASIKQSTLPAFCQGEAVILSATITGAPAVSYLWSNGDSTQTIRVVSSGTYAVTITNTLGCTANASIRVSFDATNLLSSYVILALKNVELNNDKVFSGGIGVKGVVQGNHGEWGWCGEQGCWDQHGSWYNNGYNGWNGQGWNGYTNAGNGQGSGWGSHGWNGQGNYYWNNGEIDIDGQTIITAPGTFVKANDLDISRQARVTYQYPEPADIAWPAFEAMPYHGTITKNIPNNATVTLSDTLYKQITIGKNATVTFTQPVINIDNGIQIGDGSVIHFAHCATVRMKNKITMGNNIKINPDSLSVVFYIDDDLTFGVGEQVCGTFFLGAANNPDTTKHHLLIEDSGIKGPGIYKGMFLAQEVNVGQNNYFYLNQNCNNCTLKLSSTHMASDDQNEADRAIPMVNCFPNPFTDKTTLQFMLAVDNHVKIDVYNLTGKLIQVLYEGDVNKNQKYSVEFDGKMLPTGVYIYKMTMNNSVYMGKMILIKE